MLTCSIKVAHPLTEREDRSVPAHLAMHWIAPGYANTPCNRIIEHINHTRNIGSRGPLTSNSSNSANTMEHRAHNHPSNRQSMCRECRASSVDIQVGNIINKVQRGKNASSYRPSVPISVRRSSYVRVPQHLALLHYMHAIHQCHITSNCSAAVLLTRDVHLTRRLNTARVRLYLDTRAR